MTVYDGKLLLLNLLLYLQIYNFLLKASVQMPLANKLKENVCYVFVSYF